MRWDVNKIIDDNRLSQNLVGQQRVMLNFLQLPFRGIVPRIPIAQNKSCSRSLQVPSSAEVSPQMDTRTPACCAIRTRNKQTILIRRWQKETTQHTSPPQTGQKTQFPRGWHPASTPLEYLCSSHTGTPPQATHVVVPSKIQLWSLDSGRGRGPGLELCWMMTCL